MYLNWQEKIIADFSESNLNSLYDGGFVFTRPGKGVMRQTRSVRINLSEFRLSSENRRVLKKTENLELSVTPLPYTKYHWKIGKLAKNFYETKFGRGTFSANKVKELLTDEKKSNFNRLLVYHHENMAEPIGYCIARETDNLLHYSYPFYDLQAKGRMENLGMGMMTRAILWSKKEGKKYIYLGSASRPTDTYKLNFSGLEWFDGKSWQENLAALKLILHESTAI